jgi:hypothetical protein
MGPPPGLQTGANARRAQVGDNEGQRLQNSSAEQVRLQPYIFFFFPFHSRHRPERYKYWLSLLIACSVCDATPDRSPLFHDDTAIADLQGLVGDQVQKIVTHRTELLKAELSAAAHDSDLAKNALRDVQAKAIRDAAEAQLQIRTLKEAASSLSSVPVVFSHAIAQAAREAQQLVDLRSENDQMTKRVRNVTEASVRSATYISQLGELVEARTQDLQRRVAQLEKSVSALICFLSMLTILYQTRDTTARAEKLAQENARLNDLVRFELNQVAALVVLIQHTSWNNMSVWCVTHVFRFSDVPSI